MEKRIYVEAEVLDGVKRTIRYNPDTGNATLKMKEGALDTLISGVAFREKYEAPMKFYPNTEKDLTFMQSYYT